MIPPTARWLRAAGLDALELRLKAWPAAWLWTILALAFVARIVVAAVFANFDPATAVLWEYGDIARATVEHGHGQIVAPIGMASGMASSHFADPTFVYPTADEAPFVIWVWVGLFHLFGVTKLALAMMTALNVLMSLVIVYYSIRVARALFGSEVIALMVGIVMVLHPVFVFSVGTYHAVNLYIPLLLIAFDLTLSTRRPTYASSVLVGLLAGIATLVRTEYLVLIGAILLGSLINHRQWKMTAIAALAAVLVVAPWTARNYLVLQRFIPVSTEASRLLFDGYNPETNGDAKSLELSGIFERVLGQKLDAIPLDRNYENARRDVYYHAVIEYMKSYPLRSFVVLPIYKAALFWIFDIYDPVSHIPLYQLQFWPLFVLSVIGLAIAARSGCFGLPDHRTVLVLFAFQTLVMISFAVISRYRMNVEPFLYAYAAFGVVGVWGWLRRLRISTPVGSVSS